MDTYCNVKGITHSGYSGIGHNKTSQNQQIVLIPKNEK